MRWVRSLVATHTGTSHDAPTLNHLIQSADLPKPLTRPMLWWCGGRALPKKANQS